MAAPLLFLPGLLCDSTIWSAQLKAFADVGPPVVAAYGDARTLEEMARRALAGAPPTFSLVGHSMGARVALEVFRAAPERVERLALLNTGVHPVGSNEIPARLALLELGRREGIEALVDSWLPPMLHPARRADPSVMEPLRAMCRRAGLATFECQVEALLARPDPTPLLSAIRCRTLVATGRQDEWSPVGQHRQIADAIPSAEFVVFENSGHMAPFEEPGQVNAALLRWLNGAPALGTI